MKPEPFLYWLALILSAPIADAMYRLEALNETKGPHYLLLAILSIVAMQCAFVGIGLEMVTWFA
jgi:hypothetical protein